MYEIVVGRTDSDKKDLGLQGTVFLGKHYVRMGNTTSLSNRIYLDIAKTHVILISGKRGSGKCLAGDTLIQLEDGSLKPIKELRENKQKILSLDEKLKITKAEKTEFFERIVNKLLKIKLRSGKEIELTPEHPLLTIKGWKEAQTINPGGRIATPKIISTFGNENLEDYEIKLLAYLITKGHTKKITSFANRDEIIVNDFKESLRKLDHSLELRKEKEAHYKITNPNLENVVENIGEILRDKKNGGFINGSKIEIRKRSIRKLTEKYKLSIVKEIPEEIIRLNKEKLSLFLNRIFSCDGSIYPIKNNGWEISYCSSSKELINIVQNLILRFGIISKLINKTIRYKGKVFHSFELVLNEENVVKYIENIGFFGKKKEGESPALEYFKKTKRNPNVDTIPKELWELYKPKNWAEIERMVGYAYPKAMKERIEYCHSRQTLLQISKADENEGLKTLAESDIFWDEIISMELLEGEFKVYDLCIPELHNFIANDIIVHNSHSLGVIAEEMADLPVEVKNKIAVLMIDTMGIFWTMRYPNLKDEELLEKWKLPKKTLDIKIYVPAGYIEEYKAKGIPADLAFKINPSELSALDWCNSFDIKITSQIGVAIESTLAKIRERGNNYSIEEINLEIGKNKDIDQDTKFATINRFLAAKSWGIFSNESTKIKEMVSGGKVSVLDVSAYKEENIKALVTGLVCKKLMEERVITRKEEEMEDISKGHSYFKTSLKKTGENLPLVWILIDEAHIFLKKEGKTAATDALVTILREGRQPGISLILATQQPGEIHKDVITQTDIVLSHRITAKKDIEALNEMMQSYLPGAIQKYFNLLPKDRGSAIILDDNSEKIYPLQVRPRFTWHGGEAPTAIKAKGKAATDLGL